MTSSRPRRPLGSHSLVCSKNHLFFVGIKFSIRSIRSYVCFMLDNSTIRYICDTYNLNIICILSYFNIFSFLKHYLHYNIYAIILITLHRNTGPSRCIFLVFIVHLLFLRTINCDYSQL